MNGVKRIITPAYVAARRSVISCGVATRPRTFSTTTPPTPSPPAKFTSGTEVTFEIHHGWQRAEMLNVLVTQGIIDALADGSKTAREVAAKTNLIEEKLYRLLRTCAVEGLVGVDDATDKFSLNEVSKLYVGNNSWAPLVHYLFFSPLRAAYAALPTALREDKCAFNEAVGEPFYDWFKKNPGLHQVFNTAMTKISDNPVIFGKNLLEAYSFAHFRKIVDVGGGEGALLAGILRKCPPTTIGIVTDMAPVLEPGKKKLTTEYKDVQGRLTFEPCNFFESVPAGGDAYIAKQVCFNWNDENAMKILRSINKAIPARGKLLLIEFMTTSQNKKFSYNMDMTMMVIFDGKQRSEREFAVLLEKTGFMLERVIPITESAHVIIEAVKKE